MGIRTSDEMWLRARSLSRALLRTTTLRHRHFDYFVASMPHSGTHWACYMLGLTLAKLYDLPPPAHIGSNSIVGHLTSPPLYAHIPQIITTHSIPHISLRSRTLVRVLHFPKSLILVRDIRDALVAHYEKHKGDFNVDFSTYLRGDVRGKTYTYDIWKRIQFLNGWGPVVERHPERTAVLKYEDLKADTRGELARVCDYFHIKGVTPALLDEVVAAASKEEMAKRPGPKRTGANLRVVRMDSRPAEEWYSDEDRGFVAELCRRNLKYAFGYRY